MKFTPLINDIGRLGHFKIVNEERIDTIYLQTSIKMGEVDFNCQIYICIPLIMKA